MENQGNLTSYLFRINTFTVVFLVELNKRNNSYDTVNKNFGFLFDITKLLLSMVREQAIKLQQEYLEDLGSSFTNKCIYFPGHLSELQDNDMPKIV